MKVHQKKNRNLLKNLSENNFFKFVKRNKSMELKKIEWGSLSGNPVWVYRISDNVAGFEIEICNVGATINRFKMTDSKGNIEDIAYGWDSLDALLSNMGNSYLGATVGRTASITVLAEFENDGVTYHLTKNMMGMHHQHGGFSGFHKKWMKPVSEQCSNNMCSLIFEFNSPEGEEGYPGNLKGTVEYRITSGQKEIQFEYIIKATTDKTTPVSIVNHAYWNLDGVGKTIDDLSITIDADKYLAFDLTKIVLKSVGAKVGLGKKSKDPMEIQNLGSKKPLLRHPLKFSDIFAKYGDIDDNYLLDKNSESITKDGHKLTHAVTLKSEKTGRQMDIYTTEPAIIVYSGNYMDKINTMGIQCKKHYAICLETCKPSNSVRLPEFREAVLLRPDQEYCHHSLLKFKIE